MLTQTLGSFQQIVQPPAAMPSFSKGYRTDASGGLLTQNQWQLESADKTLLAAIPAVASKWEVFSRQSSSFMQAPAESAIRKFSHFHTTFQFGSAVRGILEQANQVEHDIHNFQLAIKRLIENEHLQAARRMFEAVPLHLFSDPLLLGLRAVLAPPVVKRLQKQDVERSNEYDWLRDEGHKYRGKWVALQGKRVLSAASTLRTLRQQLQSMKLTRPPLIHHIQ